MIAKSELVLYFYLHAFYICMYMYMYMYIYVCMVHILFLSLSLSLSLSLIYRFTEINYHRPSETYKDVFYPEQKETTVSTCVYISTFSSRPRFP